MSARPQQGRGGHRGATVAAEEKPEKSGRSLVIGLVLVVLTAVGLVLSATQGPLASDHRPTSGKQAPGLRSTVPQLAACTGGVPGARQLVAVDGGTNTAPVGDKPAIVKAPATAVLGATQVAEGANPAWFAYAECPQPRATYWFTGLGGSSTHQSTLTLSNPRDGVAVVTLTALGAKGPLDAPALRGVTIPSKGVKRIDLSKAAPTPDVLSVLVSADRGLVSATASDATAVGEGNAKLSAWLPSQAVLRDKLALTGLPAKATGGKLTVANPSDKDALVKVQVVGPSGTFTPKELEKPLQVPARSTAVFDVKAALAKDARALYLDASSSIAANVRVTTAKGAATVGGNGPLPVQRTSALTVPVGAPATLVVSSIGKAGKVTVSWSDGRAGQSGKREITVAARTAQQVPIPDWVREVQVRPESGELTAAVSLGGNKVAALGFTTSARSAARAGVVSGW